MSKYPLITKEVIAEHGISDKEYSKIKEILLIQEMSVPIPVIPFDPNQEFEALESI